MPKQSNTRLRGAALDDGLTASQTLRSSVGQSPEQRLVRAAGSMSRKMAQAVGELERYSDTLADELSQEHQAGEAELRQALRDVLDRLAETEAERDALWEELERRRTEITNLNQAVTQATQIHDLAHTMAATRGWKMLEAFRRIRRSIIGR